MPPISPQEPWAQVSEVLRLIRSGEAQTRPELADAAGLGRNVITLRIQAAESLGLIQPSGELRSRGGRAAEVWEVNPDAARLLVGIIGANQLRVVLADLRLKPIADHIVDWPYSGPEETCERMAQEMEALLADEPLPLWGVGIGMLAPVDFFTGRSADPVTPTVAGQRWPRDFDVRRWFVRRLNTPVWVESLSNLMALGAAAEPGAPDDLIAIRMELGVGSGIVSDGKVHRGADWIAGETNHIVVQPDSERICMCGRLGCLDAFAGAWAVEADAHKAIAQGRPTVLAAKDQAEVDLDAIVDAAESGDIPAAEIVLRAADALGRVLAAIVTWFNPRRVVIGGNALASSQLFHGAMSRTLYAVALSASVRQLELRQGRSDHFEEVLGALTMVRDALFSQTFLSAWGPLGAPDRVDQLHTRESQF